MKISERIAQWRDNLEGDFIAAVEVAKFLPILEAEHPDELAAWEREMVAQHLTQSLAQQERRRRTTLMRRRFAEAVEAESDLGVFGMTFVVDGNNNRRPLPKMTRKDLRYAAQDYEMRGRWQYFVRAFLLALEHRMDRLSPDATVGDALSEQEVERLRETLYSGFWSDQLAA